MLNQPNASNSFWTDDELLTYANEGIRRYYTEVVKQSNGEFMTSILLDLVANTELVALPSNFFQIRAVYRTMPNGYQIMDFKNNLTDDIYTNISGGPTYVPYYYLRGNNLVLRPVANFAESGAFYVEYVYFPDTLLTGGDTLTSDVSPVFRDLIEAYMVYKAKVKQSLNNGMPLTPSIKENLDDLYTAFKETMNKRSQQPTFISQFDPETC